MKAIGYVRVSTDAQVERGVSLEMQEEKLRAYASLLDLNLIEIIHDDGISAKSVGKRPGMQRALKMLTTGEVRHLVIFKLDRAFRNAREALEVAEMLQKNGFGLHSATERIDTTSSHGKLFYTMLAAMAEWERNVISERTAAALQSKKLRGERVGEIPFGYALDTDGVHLMPDAQEQRIIARIRELKGRGHSFRQIAAELNRDGYTTKKGAAWTHRQVSRIYREAA